MLLLKSFHTDLPFQYPFKISKGTKTQQNALVVALGFGNCIGWGEAPQIGYYTETVSSMAENLARVQTVIERYSLTDPRRFWHFLHHLLPEQHFLIAALDIAGWDLYAQLRKKPLFEVLQLPPAGKVLCDYTIGLDSAEIMLKKMKEHPAKVYKVKLASASDIDLLRSLRTATGASFRVDVNEGWTYDETLMLLPELQALGVVLLEQPLPKHQWEEMVALKGQSDIPLFADEACVREADIAQCATAFHGINIKLTKCGGITPALNMIDEARKKNLGVMLGCMNESVIGTAALVHMAAAVDFLDADGPLLLKEANASGLTYDEEGFVWLHEGNGLAISVNPSVLKPVV